MRAFQRGTQHYCAAAAATVGARVHQIVCARNPTESENNHRSHGSRAREIVSRSLIGVERGSGTIFTVILKVRARCIPVPGLSRRLREAG